MPRTGHSDGRQHSGGCRTHAGTSCDDGPMSDRDPFWPGRGPTEVFPPFPSPPPGSPAAESDLPPLGSANEPDPTRVMPRTDRSATPTTAMPSTGGPYDPGPPYGADRPGGAAGRPERRYEPGHQREDDPWYRQPGPLAALIAGVAAPVVALIALLVWTSDDDDDTIDDVTDRADHTSTTLVESRRPATPPTEPETTTRARPQARRRRPRRHLDDDQHDAPADETEAPTTTATPTTTTTVPEIIVPAGSNLLQIIQGNEGPLGARPSPRLHRSGLGELEVGRCADRAGAIQRGVRRAAAGQREPQTSATHRISSRRSCCTTSWTPISPLRAIRSVRTRSPRCGGEAPVNDDGTIGSTDAAIVVPDVRGSNGGDPGRADLGGSGAYERLPWPFSSNGFRQLPRRHRARAHDRDPVLLPDGTEMWALGADGVERLVGVFDGEVWVSLVADIPGG